ncbi:MAG: choice-of-anchor V domain-containing protein [Bacteroidia bacterium]
MKKNIITLIFTAVSLLLFTNYTVFRKTAGSHPGSNGAPGDQTCAASGCHADAMITPSAVNNCTLIFSSQDSSYVPGATYNVTVQTKGIIPTSKFGFECVAIKDNGNLNIGQFSITDFNPIRTQIVNYPSGSETRYSVTHTSAGTPALSANFSQWTFDWTAPPVNEGTITFYYATNCTNNDAANTGDAIFLNTFQIHPANTTLVKDLADQYDLQTSFDRSNNAFKLKFDLKGTRNVQISVLDINGKVIYNGPSEVLSNEQDKHITIKNKLSSGSYIVLIQIEEQKVTKKLAIN